MNQMNSGFVSKSHLKLPGQQKPNERQNNIQVHTAIIGDIHQGLGVALASFLSVLHSVFYSKRHFLLRDFLSLSWSSRQRCSRQWDLLCLVCGLTQVAGVALPPSAAHGMLLNNRVPKAPTSPRRPSASCSRGRWPRRTAAL